MHVKFEKKSWSCIKPMEFILCFLIPWFRSVQNVTKKYKLYSQRCNFDFKHELLQLKLLQFYFVVGASKSNLPVPHRQPHMCEASKAGVALAKRRSSPTLVQPQAIKQSSKSSLVQMQKFLSPCQKKCWRDHNISFDLFVHIPKILAKKYTNMSKG